MSRSSKKGPWVEERLMARIEALNAANNKKMLKGRRGRRRSSRRWWATRSPCTTGATCAGVHQRVDGRSQARRVRAHARLPWSRRLWESQMSAEEEKGVPGDVLAEEPAAGKNGGCRAKARPRRKRLPRRRRLTASSRTRRRRRRPRSRRRPNRRPPRRSPPPVKSPSPARRLPPPEKSRLPAKRPPPEKGGPRGKEPSVEKRPLERRARAARRAKAPAPAKKPAGSKKLLPGRKGESERKVPRRRVVRAHARYVRTSARKARMVCGHLRGKSVQEARAILAFTPRDVARDWSKLLRVGCGECREQP